MNPPASSSLLATTNLENLTISIPLDVLLEILSRLPIETLYRCRYASKSWLQLIDDHFLKNSLPSTVAGFFYQKNIYGTIYAAKGNNDIYNIDPTFSFLPCHGDFTIESCRNGLILGSGIIRSYDRENLRVIKDCACFVCNPATKSWIMLPKLARANPILLDFNPRSSPHYRVFSVDTDKNCWIYSSRTRKWSLQDQGAFRAAFLWEKYMVTFWKEAAYSITYGPGTGSFLTRGYKLLTRLPVETNVRREICLGELQELGLCLAHLHGFRLTVWSHGGEAADEWVIRHRSYVDGLRHQECRGREGDRIRCLAFHPFEKAVFIAYDKVIYLYRLGGMGLEEFCRLRSYNTKYDVVFPFLPCLLDVTGDGTDVAEGRDVEKD